MKKFTVLALCLILAFSLLTACGGTGAKEVLNLYTWEGMFPQEVLDSFTEETGIEVNYSSFDAGETMLSKLEASKGGDYDVVLVDDYIIETAVKEGLVMPLDLEKIPNFGNINPIYQGQFYDPENLYTVPYGAGVQTIIYNPELVEHEITGYADLWDPSLKSSIGITGNPRVISGMALKLDGESYNTEDVAAIERAGEHLIDLAPNIRLIKDDSLQDDLISGEISVGILYTSQATQACVANPDFKMVYPKEGIGFGIMAQFIPANAPNAEAAHKFIDYILRPEVSKQCFEFLGYYCTNKAADPLIDEPYRSFLTLPEGFKVGEMEIMNNISAEAMETHTHIWTEFRTACGQ